MVFIGVVFLVTLLLIFISHNFTKSHEGHQNILYFLLNNTLNLMKIYYFTAHHCITDQHVSSLYKYIDQQTWFMVTPGESVERWAAALMYVRKPVELKKSFSVFFSRLSITVVMPVATVTHDISCPGNPKAQSLVPFFYYCLFCSIRSSKGGKSHLLFILTLFMWLSLSLPLSL